MTKNNYLRRKNTANNTRKRTNGRNVQVVDKYKGSSRKKTIVHINPKTQV